MQEYVAKSTKNVIFTAHVETVLNRDNNIMEVKVPLQGKLGKKGIEPYFNNIVSTKIIELSELKDYKNPLLTVTEKEKIQGIKRVFQTDVTADTLNEKIRGPRDMWSIKETFIDNDVQHVFDRFDKYYK
jgi:hypothetical protein